MKRLITQSQSLLFSLALAAGMSGVAFAQNGNSAATNPNNNGYQSSAQDYQNNAQSGNHSQAEVRQVQQKLKNDGYYTGKVDGIDGPMTQQALRKYQRSQNIKANGKLDHKTLSKLGVNGNQDYR